MQQRKQRSPAIAILLALVSAAGLVVAAFGPRWMIDPDHDEIGFGLRSYDLPDGRKPNGSMFDLVDRIEAEITLIKLENKTRPPQQQIELPRKPWHGFPVVGMIAFVGSLLAAAGLVGGATLALMGKRPELPIMPTTIAVLGLTVALINGCIFVATKPAEIHSMMVGWSFMTFGGGIVTGLASVFPLNRRIRPIDHELGAAASTMSWGGSRDDMP